MLPYHTPHSLSTIHSFFHILHIPIHSIFHFTYISICGNFHGIQAVEKCSSGAYKPTLMILYRQQFSFIRSNRYISTSTWSWRWKQRDIYSYILMDIWLLMNLIIPTVRVRLLVTFNVCVLSHIIILSSLSLYAV